MTQATTSTVIRVLLVDDHVIVRKGLLALLAESPDIDVVGEASNGAEAIHEAARLAPDVVLMDLVMPEMDGTEAIASITAQHPSMRILVNPGRNPCTVATRGRAAGFLSWYSRRTALVITTFSTDEQVFAAIKAGAHGYLLKDAGSDDLTNAIRRIYRGEPSLHPLIARKLMQEVAQPTSQERAPEPLTARELQILNLVASGMNDTDIAAQLHVQEVTVRSHVSRILDKLHVANRVQATLFALREGLASLNDPP